MLVIYACDKYLLAPTYRCVIIKTLVYLGMSMHALLLYIAVSYLHRTLVFTYALEKQVLYLLVPLSKAHYCIPWYLWVSTLLLVHHYYLLRHRHKPMKGLLWLCHKAEAQAL